MKVRIVQHDSELEALASDWDRLAGDRTFCRHSWMTQWWYHYRRGNQLFVLVVEANDGQVVGIAPFYKTFSAKTGRCVRFLGSNNVCSDYLRVLVDHDGGYDNPPDEYCTEIINAVAQQLVMLNGQKLTRWDMLELSGGIQEDPVNSTLIAALQNYGFRVHHHAIENSWRVELPATWEEYAQRFGKSFRRIINRLNREFIQPGRVRLVEAVDEDTLNLGWSILVELHQRRRESLGQPGCFADPRFTAFLRSAAESSLAQGELLLQWIEFESQPMSASICFAHAGCINMFQSGINPDLLDKSPGHLQNMLAIQSAIKNGMTAYDFLRGDEPYKRLWRANPVRLESTRVVAGRMMPILRHQTWVAKQALNVWMKSGQEPANSD